MILIKNLHTLVTCNDQDQILQNVDLLIEGPKIRAIGKHLTFDGPLEVIDGRGKLAVPGLVNTHHHLYQTLFRGLSEVQGMPLFSWLLNLYEFWKHLTPDAVYFGSQVGFAELLRTGCTLTTDHHYVFPKGQPTTLIDSQIHAAQEIGIRFHPTRGSMSRGKSHGGLPPDEVVQTEEEILKDSQRLIETYHDPSPFAMTRLSLAPCSPFSVSKDLMVQARKLARSAETGVMLHTHLAETLDEEKFCLEIYGCRPVELMEELEWVGPDVWFAHAIHLSNREINVLANSGVAHCPSSNMKLGSGICRTSELVKAGVKLGIGVDGSASNDGSNMWEEVRRTYLLNHLRYADAGLSAYETIKAATRGGAEVLGRNDTGILQEGMAADLALINLEDVAFAGCHDPLVSLVCCGNTSIVDMTIVNGRIVVRDGQLTTLDPEDIRVKAHRISTEMVEKERALKINS